MSFNENFSISQTLGTPNICTFKDTSTGSDGEIELRKIYLLKADGTYIKDGVNNYFSWNYNDETIDLDVINRDYGLSVTVEWLNGVGAILYTKNYKVDLVAYTSNFINELTQQETALPSIRFTLDYFQKKGQLQTLVECADKAIMYGADYKKAQVFLNEAYGIINDKNKYF
jgi:hypothetical protein